MPKERLDKLAVDRGLLESRERARAAIMAGLVLVDGRVEDKPGHSVSTDARVELRGAAHPFVSRGGVKLAGALDAFGLDVAGLVALDIGASTGGFTDCLLQRGAARVFAVDVGRGQLAQRLVDDLRVVSIEGTNARALTLGDIPSRVDLATIDVSFISLTKILPVVPLLLSPTAVGVLAMVKPQFEAGPKLVGKHGVVRDPSVRAECVTRVLEAGAQVGLGATAVAPSLILGPKGNAEFFLWFRPGQPPMVTREQIDAAVLSVGGDVG